ncbi:MAG: transglutaminaseTgpA domain-containing protein [Acidimicrobiia bacterium]|nr:transglutaminaseTgpA domain-containing protein [Acidimicrobiia bacterium]
MRFWEALKDANRAVEPEQSLAVRFAVGATVMVAVMALLSEQLVGLGPAAAALLGIPIGFTVSHLQRHSDALVLKAFLAVALIAAVVAFVGQLVTAAEAGFANVQTPLAELFLWVQVLHSLHVPSRRDLMFSLASSGAMLSITAALSVSLGLGIFVAVWAICLTTSLTLAYRSQLLDLPTLRDDESSMAGGLARSLGITGSVVIVIAVAAFFVLPAARSSRAFTFPMQLPSSIPLPNPGALSNPTLGGGGGDSDLSAPGGGGASFGYFGFAESLDTSLRGRPDDTLVMRVRAPAPAFWRGQTFDTWNGRVWTISDDETMAIGGGTPIDVAPTLGDASAPGSEFIQTFYLERTGPNVIFGAYRIEDVYFPERFLFQLSEGTLRTGVGLGADTVYTVISRRPAVTADLLREADPLVYGVPDALARRYLQVPDVPGRVLDLASEVTAGAPTTYDKIKALESWMADNTTYSLDIPALPAGEDAVDHYLFETRQGFCEQIGTSLVVMLRSIGVPARLVVGYLPGDRNPFTGLYEVKASDAHSWAEVWFPGVGWQGFDPTASVPLSGEADLPSTAGAGLFDYLSERLPGLTSGILFVIKVTLGGGAAAVLASLAGRWHQERRRRRDRSWVEATVERLEEEGSIRERPREAHETTREFVAALQSGPLRDPRLAEIAAAIDDAAFSLEGLGRADREAIDAVFDSVAAKHPASSVRRPARF